MYTLRHRDIRRWTKRPVVMIIQASRLLFLLFILIIFLFVPLLLIIQADRLSQYVSRTSAYSTFVVHGNGQVKDSSLRQGHEGDMMTILHQGLKSGERLKSSETRFILEAEHYTKSSLDLYRKENFADYQYADNTLEVKDSEGLRGNMEHEMDYLHHESSSRNANFAIPNVGSDTAKPEVVQHAGVPPAMAKIYDAILYYFSFYGYEQKDSFVNLHRFGYQIDSRACADPGDVLVLVHSKYNNFDRRKKARTTWAYNKTVYGVKFNVVFFLGQPPMVIASNKTLEQIKNVTEKSKVVYKFKTDPEKRREEEMKLLEENREYGDIVMGNFTDAYRNLTIKHIMVLGWALSHCPKVKYILKVDDDTIVNTYSVGRHVKSDFKNVTGLLLCQAIQEAVVFRERFSKWKVDNPEYPFSLYPPYCSGFSIFLTSDVLRKLYDASKDVKPYWVDDVYVTGMLAWRAGVTPVELTGNMTSVRTWRFNQSHTEAFFVNALFRYGHKQETYWQKMVAAQENLQTLN